MNIADTITLEDDTLRLVVAYDEDAQCPRGDWHMLTGFYKIQGRGDSRRIDVPALYDFPGDINRAHDELETPRQTRLHNSVVERWARIFYGQVVEYDSQHGGYWFVQLDGDEGFAANWPGLELGTAEHLAQQAEVIQQERATYETWASGEVYGVILQKAVDLYELDDMGIATDREALRVWDDIDSLWGCYLDDTYTARDVAAEHFGIEKEVTANV